MHFVRCSREIAIRRSGESLAPDIFILGVHEKCDDGDAVELLC